jgi:hypothetical protein
MSSRGEVLSPGSEQEKLTPTRLHGDSLTSSVPEMG